MGPAWGHRHSVRGGMRVDESGERDMEAEGVYVCEGDSGGGRSGRFPLQGVGTGATGSCLRNRDARHERG